MKSNFDKYPSVGVTKNISDCIVGWDAVCTEINKLITSTQKEKVVVAIDCYQGVLQDEVLNNIRKKVKHDTFILSVDAFKPEKEILKLVHPDVTDDQVFGHMTQLTIDKYFDAARLQALRKRISVSTGIVIIFGEAAAFACESYDLLFYLDMARWEIQLRMRRSEVNNLGVHNKTAPFALQYKQAYFVDWRVLDKHKMSVFDRIDYFIDTNKAGKPKMVSRELIQKALDITSHRPFRVVPFFDPGPWGGQWLKEVADLDRSVVNYAWGFDCVPEENSLLLKFGDETVEIPSIDVVLRKPVDLLGQKVYERFGAEFPIRFDFLDTMGGGNLSLQVHPTTQYIKEHFGMDYTQDESYYMLDAAEGAHVYLGLREDVVPEKMIADLKRSQNGGTPFDAEKHVEKWPVKKHDHVLIPAGTVHCSGKDSVVLEISATPYIFTFKLWDWGRLGLDGKPRPININHGEQVIQWDRRRDWTGKNLVNRFEKVAEGDGWTEERTGLHELQFIETRRHWFSKTVPHDTNGGVNVINLIEGKEAIVESPDNAFEPFIIHYAETFIVPASVGKYTITPHGESAGKQCGTLKAFIRCILLLFCLLPFSVLRAEVKLPVIFRDNMVLQRDTPLPIYGWASPGEKVNVSLSDRSGSATADKSGKWKVVLNALPAGGPYQLKVDGKNSIVLNDVLLGDVWICGGQSNMQWSIEQTGFEEADSAFLKNGQVRLFTVDLDMDYLPKEDIKGGNGWNKLSKDNIKWFSAVAYHFGKSLNKQTNVPVGLVACNLGATSIETWMSNESLLKFPQFKQDIEPVVRRNKSYAQLNADFGKIRENWFKKYYYKGVGVEEEWYKVDVDLSAWKPINASGNDWSDEPELKDHDGAVWFRTTFDLPANYHGKTFHVGLLQTDDYDIAWVNGVKVGENFGNYNHHGYDVSMDVLKPKGNVLVVRVFDIGGTGGFITHPFWGNFITNGKWIYRKGESIDARKFPKPEFPNATPFSSPSVLFNGNIAPLTQVAIKGVIWYQGEANADRAEEYRSLFPEMITDWRNRWAVGDFPFVFAQLANYGAESAQPVASPWAELREAQASVLTSLPNTYMAAAIDIGEANDIHPKNKEDVGKRLALAFTKHASGPTYKSITVKNDRTIVEYQSSDIHTKDKYGFVRGFQVAGDDQKFYWAKAVLVGDKVEVWSDNVPKPVAVRYAWDNNPGPLDLYNALGLPALPFRSDSWPRITKGQVFKTGQPRF